MPSPCGRRAMEACCNSACCISHHKTSGDDAATTTTARSSRSNFAVSAVSALFPNSQFTNHESLPSLQESFSIFSSAFPHYFETMPQADLIRNTEYPHLSHQICLDYSGVGLFSLSQAYNLSSSSHPFPFFNISYKSSSIKCQVQYGEQDAVFESSIKSSIFGFLKISPDDYVMISTANRTTAFRLVAETYPFQSSNRLLTVYDYESEAIKPMVECAMNRGAKVKAAAFSWPDLGIHSRTLKKMLRSRSLKKKKKKMQGLFVFPLMSRMTGVRYPYLWMKMAQENGWHVLLDACTLCPKDMDTMGMALIQPDFIICSFYKVFGQNPSGFAGVFIKKSNHQVLETSELARSIDVVSIVRARRTMPQSGEEDMDMRSFSGPLSSTQKVEKKYEEGEASEKREQIVEEEVKAAVEDSVEVETDQEAEIELRGLNHADSLGLPVIQSRLRCITNWLVIALKKLSHPHSSNGHNSLVRIYGPEVKFDRGSAIAFNVYDWKGEKVEPALVQRLADRSSISLNCGFLQNSLFSDHKKYEQKKQVVEKSVRGIVASGYRKQSNRKKESSDVGIAVVSASLGFLVNFEDAYLFWAFVAKFLDADFVEKERWRYIALNQRLVEI